MILKRIEDNLEEHYFYQKRNTNTGVTICLYSVLFGTRVRVYHNEWYCDADYCGGNNQKLVEELYSITETILYKIEEKNYRNFNWPIPERKPISNDPECLNELRNLAGKVLIKQDRFPDINLIRYVQNSYILKR